MEEVRSGRALQPEAAGERVPAAAWLKALCPKNQQIAPGAEGNLKVYESCQRSAVLVTAHRGQGPSTEPAPAGGVPSLSGCFSGLSCS